MIEQYTIRSGGGISVDLLNIGAAVASIRVPSSRGEIDVIAQGMSTEDFLANTNYCGVTSGRYANRLANACIHIDGVDYRLSANDASGRHCLHGGEGGLHLAVWEAPEQDDDAITYERNVLKEAAASVIGRGSGLRLDVYTSQPGLQFYTANHAVQPIARRGGLCLEAQNFPDAPNQAGFPSALVRPDEEYYHFVAYRFSRDER